MSVRTTSAVGGLRAPSLGPAILIGLAVLLGLLVGGIVALGSLTITAMLAAVLGALAMTGFPRLLFWFSVVGAMVLAGLFELYLPGLNTLRWAFAGATWLFFLAVLVRQLWSHERAQGSVDPLVLACAAFFFVCITSLLINWRGGAVAATGAKNYFEAWGLLLGLAIMAGWEGLERKLFRALLVIGVVQLPFVLHQFLVLAPRRMGMGHGIVAVDVVAGTFGASFTGGGNNAVLATFLIIVSALLLAIWRTGALQRRWLWLLVPLLVPIFMNESKISVVYLVLAYLVVFRREVLRRPVRFIGMSMLLAVMSVGLVLSYVALHQSNKYKDPAALIEHVVRQNTEEGERYGNLELNRTTALVHWWKEQRRYPMTKTLFGHGPGASREAIGVLDVGKNLASQVYPGMGIGVTSVSSLLWDVGIIGLLATLGIFAAAASLAGKLAKRHDASPARAGAFQGLQAAVLILALSLMHKNSFMYQLAHQVIVCLVLGYLLYANRQLQPPDVSPAARTTRFVQ